MDNQAICSECQSPLPEDGGAPVLCAKCDLYHIYTYPWNTMAEFFEFLNGKRFVLHRKSIGGYGPDDITKIQEFASAMVTSPDVIEIRMACFASPEELIGISDLVAKLPKCKGMQLGDFTITEHTAPYLAKLMAYPHVRTIALQQATFGSLDAVKVFADSMQPDRFLVLSIEECNIPSIAPILNALVNANIDTIPYLLDRQFDDEEFKAFMNLYKNNKHLKEVYASRLSNKQSRELAENIQANSNVKKITFNRCDLVTAIPAIAETLRNSQNIIYCNISFCSLTLALLTDLCEGLRERTSTADLILGLADRNYTDSLEPIKILLEDKIRLPGLHLYAGSAPQEWLHVTEALKTNTTLKKLDLSIVHTNAHIIEDLTSALKINTALRELRVSTELFAHVLDELVTDVVSQNRLETFSISDGTLQELNFSTLCNLLKKNWKMKKLRFPGVDDTEENVKIFKGMLEENCFLTECDIIKNAFAIIKPYKERNLKYQEQWTETKQNILVLLHNLARNAETIRKLLPIENWIDIFGCIRHPLLPQNSFESAAKKIFRKYKLY